MATGLCAQNATFAPLMIFEWEMLAMDSVQTSGTVLRGLLNDIKRRPEDAAVELGIAKTELEKIIAGTQPLSFELIKKACSIWPLNERDFFSKRDDCPSGMRVMRAAESKTRGRVMERAGIPYYEYRDTAMSSVAPFRPEWIAELCVVEDNDPNNPLVQWNKGHFMHQFTYFIGPVNFYYLSESGEKKVAVMNTGDSMYISPFVPHTFTTRKNDEGVTGLILALTYGDKVASEAHHELGAVGTILGKEFFADFSTREQASGALIAYYRNALNIPLETVAAMAEISVQRMSDFEAGKTLPDSEEASRIAAALSVNTRDLLPPDRATKRVVLLKQSESRSWQTPADDPLYTISELASTLALPNSKALRVTVQNPEGKSCPLTAGLHQYGYNIGTSAVELRWSIGDTEYKETIAPGDSFFNKPYLPITISGKGELLMLRIGGNLGGEAVRDLSAIGAKYAERVIHETEQWFSAEGKR